MLIWQCFYTFLFNLEKRQIMWENFDFLVIFNTCDVVLINPFLCCHLLYLIIYLSKSFLFQERAWIFLNPRIYFRKTEFGILCWSFVTREIFYNQGKFYRKDIVQDILVSYLNLSSIDFIDVEVFIDQFPSLSVISITGVDAVAALNTTSLISIAENENNFAELRAIVLVLLGN